MEGVKEPKDVSFSAVDSIERLPLSEQVYVTPKAILTGAITKKKTK